MEEEKNWLNRLGSGEAISPCYYIIQCVVMSEIYCHQAICGLNFKFVHVVAAQVLKEDWNGDERPFF